MKWTTFWAGGGGRRGRPSISATDGGSFARSDVESENILRYLPPVRA